jgi:hypothetical protein
MTVDYYGNRPSVLFLTVGSSKIKSLNIDNDIEITTIWKNMNLHIGIGYCFDICALRMFTWVMGLTIPMIGEDGNFKK